MGDKNELLDLTGSITVDHGVLFRMETTAIAGFVPVTAVLQTLCITVISNCQYFSVINGGNDRANGKPFARVAPSNSLSKLHIYFFKGWTVFHHSIFLTVAAAY